MITARRVLVAAVVALSVAAPRLAQADTTAQDSAVAQSLYDEAKKLMAASKWGEACPKLEESQRLDPTPVTEFYLADCYEKSGRTASAWTTFLDLASSARRMGGAKAAEREKVARDRASALEPKLSQLTVDVPAAVRVPGLVVKRDGEVVREGQWGSPVAVDPGSHTIEASAPGKKTWTTSQSVAGAGTSTTVHVEALADEPGATTAPTQTASNPPPPPGGEQPAPTSSSPLKTVGLVVAGVGVVGIAVGTIFGLQALSKNSDSNNGHCGPPNFGDPNQCDSTGVGLRSDATSAGTISTIGFIAGGALLAGGAAMWFFAPSSHVQAAPAVGTNSGGFLVKGTF
ncbi:MAG TPA: hypothetical protein VIF15_00195 [Polyangiaceae bacterium]|jgi:hypothetical protein